MVKTNKEENTAHLESNIHLLEIQHTLHFRDGVRKIDGILVYNKTKPSQRRDTFLRNLQEQGLQLENEHSLLKPTRVYVKIHAPINVLKKYTKIYGIPSKKEQITIIPQPEVPLNILKTILNDPNPDPKDPVAQRAWESISKQQPKDFTNCERHSIVFTMMHHTAFGPERFMVGVSQLMYKNDIVTAYPLHDGTWNWPEKDSAPLNDRQLLAKYWASCDMWYKQQPLNTIEQYFGPEIAMYFGWLGFYNQMLIIASILGIITFLYGFVNIAFVVKKPIKEACESDLLMCPYCRSCKPMPLKSYCWYFKIAALNDNLSSVVFACAMSFWATSFIELWKRRQNTYILKWNLDTNVDDVFRPEFQAKAKHVRRHHCTGELEYYIPLYQRLLKYTLSITVVIIMVTVVIATTLTIIIYECILKMYGVEKAYISFTSALLTVAVMMSLRKIYGLIAISLTSLEYPRTQLEFDKSYMIKMVAFSLVNSYGKLIYIAFFKGKFFTYPGDEKIRLTTFPLAAEVCDPTGCVSEIFVLLAIITIVRPVISNCLEVLSPMIKVCLNHLKNQYKIPYKNLHTWEQDFDLNATSHFRMMEEVEEMVLQYGFVTLLVAAFPLAPFLALINNIFEIRIDSNKLVKYFRRSESFKSTSINVWFDTLQAVTYFSVITNAFFITFTSNFIPEFVYYLHYKKNLSGFFAFELSKFKVVDNYWHNTNITECWYPGHRYPPEDKNAYQFTYMHFYILSCRLGFAIIFTMTILCLTAIMSYAIPDIPTDIKDLISHNARKLRQNSVT